MIQSVHLINEIETDNLLEVNMRDKIFVKTKKESFFPFRRILSVLLAASMVTSCLSLPAFAANTLTTVNPETYADSITLANSVHDSLGIAQNFGLFSDGIVTLNAHTNGNIVANTLVSGSSVFGTRSLQGEVSYVR